MDLLGNRDDEILSHLVWYAEDARKLDCKTKRAPCQLNIVQ